MEVNISHYFHLIKTNLHLKNINSYGVKSAILSDEQTLT